MKNIVITYLLTLMVLITPQGSLAGPQTVGVNTPIISLTTASPALAAQRPDIAGAVGIGNDVVVATNQNLASLTKNGLPGSYDTNVSELDRPTFEFDTNQIANVPGGSTDPQLICDPFTHRFFYTSLGTIAVSDGTQLENATWKSYNYNAYLINPRGDPTAAFNIDYDQTGIDEKALIIGGKGSGALSGNTGYVLVFQKAALLSSTPLIAARFTVPSIPGGSTNPVGVTNFDANPPFSYAIATPSSSPASAVDTLNIYRIANSDTPNPSLTTITLSLPGTSDTFSPYVCGPGSFEQIPQPYDYYLCYQVNAPIDGRVMSPAHIRDNQLYFCEMVTTNDPIATGAVAIRWYQIDLTDPDNPCVVQFGNITVPDEMMPLYNTNNFYYPSLMTNTVSRSVPSSESGCANDVLTHNMVVGFSAGRPNGLVQSAGFYIYGFLPTTGEFYNAATTGRLATDPLGQITLPITFLTNSHNGIDTQNYGDYSSSALDPADNKTIWQFVQHCDAPGSYAIQATQLLNP